MIKLGKHFITEHFVGMFKQDEFISLEQIRQDANGWTGFFTCKITGNNYIIKIKPFQNRVAAHG